MPKCNQPMRCDLENGNSIVTDRVNDAFFIVFSNHEKSKRGRKTRIKLSLQAAIAVRDMLHIKLGEK